jgi:glycosyltransferase involved in cell wall biosynthesis
MGAVEEITVSTDPKRVGAPEFSIVIPCLNEAKTLGICIEKAARELERLGVDFEIIVADNGSIDGSQQIASDLGARVVQVSARGYGNALAGGIASAGGRYVIMGDADDSYDFSTLGPFVEKLRQGNDLVVGNRFIGNIEPGAMPFLHKYLGNPVLSFIGRRLFGTPCGDIYCGLRGFDRKKIAELDLRAGGMEFAIEMIVKATMQNLRVAEVPTVLSPDNRDRSPHLRTWRDGWRSLRLLLLYSPRWLFLYPGLALLVVGLAGMAWLMPEQRTIGSVGFDVSTLLYAALAVVIGLQAVYFFITARSFGISEGLLPDDPRFRKLTGWFTLEVGLLLGLALAIAGFALSLYAVVTWDRVGFGRLDYNEVLRIVIPGSTLITIGFQTILFSLFLGMLGLKRR